MPAERTTDVDAEMAGVARRLTSRFHRDVAPEVIDAIVARCACDFAGARVTDFLGVLVERRSLEQVRALAPQA